MVLRSARLIRLGESQWAHVSVTTSWLVATVSPSAAAASSPVPLDATWNFDPAIVVALIGYTTVYVVRWRRARREGGARAASYGRLGCWVTGIAFLALGLLSPVDSLGEQLASFHMIQHLLLADLAAVFLTLGLTRWILRPVTRRLQWLEHAAGPLGHPVFGAVAYAAVMYFWHIPTFYNATLRDPVVHTLEHVSFAAAGLLYWWHLLSPIRSRMRLRGIGPILYMASTKISVGFLGILLAFAPSLLYEDYDRAGQLLGMSALDDQSLAGAIMGLEQTLVMGVVLVWLFMRMLTEADREDSRAERYSAT